MFSRGNVKEKIRVAEKYPVQKGERVCDMFAGIGYWTLPLLKRRCPETGEFLVDRVYACTT